MKIYKLSLSGDLVYHMYVHVDEQFRENIANADQESWDVATYRFKNNEVVESYSSIGTGWKVGENHLAIKLNDPKSIRDAVDSLTTSQNLVKKALLFAKKGNSFMATDFTGSTKKEFDSTFLGEIKKSGLIAWPTEVGFFPLALSCSCKGIFGGSSGCTSPTCNVVLGFCQSNSECKRTDMTSVCSCST